MKSTTTHTPAEEITRQFLHAGYQPGAPKSLPSEVLAIDARVVRRQRCPKCNRRKMRLHPFHNGNAYRGLAICKACGTGEEF